MSVIFFCADFSTFSYLKLASDSFGGVHKQYGPKREKGRLFYPMYLVTWFIVEEATNVPRKDCLPIAMSKQRTTGRKYDSCKIIQNDFKNSKLGTMS